MWCVERPGRRQARDNVRDELVHRARVWNEQFGVDEQRAVKRWHIEHDHRAVAARKNQTQMARADRERSQLRPSRTRTQGDRELSDPPDAGASSESPS